jgi:pantetheine-phosphate adenylyltransferase
MIEDRTDSQHAVYAGTFDPFTKGHEHVLMQAKPLFDRITLAIGVNPGKKTMFTLEDRLAMLRDVANQHNRMKVSSFENLYLMDYAESIGARYVIRGLRNAADFEYELSIAQINKGINPRIRTVFFMADREFADISSSVVKGLIGPKDWQKVIKEYLPMEMWERFFKILDKNS